MPLMMEGRSSKEKAAATKMDLGTDVNFGALTRTLFDYLDNKVENTTVHLNCEVRDLQRIVVNG